MTASVAAPPRTRLVALIGNPNTGKTTLFNALTGFRARTGNYPGVTVEKKHGPLLGVPGAELLDLPGTYSLAARSPDELVAVDVLLGRRADTPRPDAVVIVVDASNVERNLYLATQVLEAGLPAIVALNMTDVAASRGITIDAEGLSARLRVPVVPVVGHRREGVPALSKAIEARLSDAGPAALSVEFPPEVEAETRALAQALSAVFGTPVPTMEARRALFDVAGAAEARAIERGGAALAANIAAARERLAKAGSPVTGLEAALRYDAIAKVVDGVVAVRESGRATWTDRIDAVVTHRVFGTLIFGAIMTVVFMAIFAWAAPLMEFLNEKVFGALASWITDAGFLGGGALESLVVKGIVGGVGGVLVFLPQIAILFLFLALLEDCGYMARAAFLMDRLLRWCGLSGKSFIPMLSSFACAVPGILATRTIENRRDRFATILVAPFMTCSARLPVYALLIGAFIPATKVAGFLDARALVFVALYVLGVAVAIPTAFLLKRTLLKGEAPPFLMELPPYKVPGARTALHRVVDQGRAFIVRAGTLILATSVVVWAACYFPHDAAIDAARDAKKAAIEEEAGPAIRAASLPSERDGLRAQADAARAAADADAEGAHLRGSYMGRIGKAVEPAFAPIGWDWRVGIAVIASFPAREVVVGTLGVIYGLGEEGDAGALRDQVLAATWEDGPRRGRKVFDLASAAALLVFFALCLQCASTLAVMRRETGSWRWPIFAFVYMSTLAWTGALATATIVRAVTS